MKCVKNGAGEIRRVQNDQAESLIGKGWNYCQKSEWKAKGSKHEPVAPIEEDVIKVKKVKKSKEQRAKERAEKAGKPVESK